MEVRPGCQQTELGVIPEDWRLERIGSLGYVVRGGSPRPAGDARYFKGNYIPWLTVAALTNVPDYQLEVAETAGFLTEEGSKHSRTLDAGTLIVANSGATLGVAKVLGFKCCANDGIAAIVNQHDGEKAFLCYYINTQTRRLREVVATGNGQPNLNTGLIRQMLVPFPPLPEQRAIAAALGDVDALLGALHRLIVKKRDLRQAAMQQLLTGRTRLPGFRGEWEVKRISEIGFPQSERNVDGTALPVLTCSKHLGFVDSLSFFKNQVFSKDLSTYKVIRRGEIGYPANHVEEGSIGLQELYDVALVSPIYVVFRVAEDINSFYLHRLLKLDSYRQKFKSVTNSSVDRRGSLRWPAFSEITVHIPPTRAEQTAIATVLADTDAELAALEQRLAKTRDLKQGIMQELLTGKVRLVSPEVSHA
jgi:type I restriction enzyme S subunit